MCENCDPAGLQPVEPEDRNGEYLKEEFGIESCPRRFFWYCGLILTKLCIEVLPLWTYHLGRALGNRETRPGSYPYRYDELSPEFDQHGRGIFFLHQQAGIEDANPKNLALRQHFGEFGPWLNRLAVAGLALCLAEMVPLLYFIVLAPRRSSPLNSGEWHHHHHPRRQLEDKTQRTRKLWRKFQASLSVLFCVASAVAKLGILIAIVDAEVRLADSIYANPIISAYLDRIRAEYPRVTPEMIVKSLTASYWEASWALAAEFLYAGVLIGIMVYWKSSRLASNTVGGERSVLASSEEEQVSDLAECGWEDTGPLARAYKAQLDRKNGGAPGAPSLHVGFEG